MALNVTISWKTWDSTPKDYIQPQASTFSTSYSLLNKYFNLLANMCYRFAFQTLKTLYYKLQRNHPLSPPMLISSPNSFHSSIYRKESAALPLFKTSLKE